MNEYNEGDLVDAVKGETIIRGRLTMEGQHFWLGDSDRTVSGLTSQGGYTITVIEKAPPKVVLPTDPGVYVTTHGSVFVLNSDRDWLDFSAWNASVNNLAVANPAYHPFTRLEPAHVTAKKVLGRVSEGVPTSPAYVANGMARIIGAIGVEFGVGGNE